MMLGTLLTLVLPPVMTERLVLVTSLEDNSLPVFEVYHPGADQVKSLYKQGRK